LLHREGDDAVADVSSISYAKAFLIGVFQSLSMVPGVSRAGATILGGLFLGLSRTTIVEFSFLLAVPTMIAATGYDLFRNASSFAPEQFGVLAAGLIASFRCRPAQHQIPASVCPDTHLYSQCRALETPTSRCRDRWL
jgi:undecaprenyl-diphosphatase